ncbi:MAG: allantoinase AllB [Acidimicrobiia bacterium]|nr:allantoinase AllB [Acidimicrobiia bacterium]
MADVSAVASAKADVLVRGGTVVDPRGCYEADVAIDDGRIAEIAPDLAAGRRDEIDARGLLVLPGVIDVHVHFNEPGRTAWEGAASGSAALAAGGGTLFFDMPLNSTPCTVNGDAVDRKRAALEASSITDFGLWGGLVPGSVGEMAEMAARGVVGFKAFMCDSGLPEYPRADEATLENGMREAAALGLPVAVHAESDAIVRRLAQECSGPTAREFLASRPVRAETEAIDLAVRLAGRTGAKLHIVHVSSGAGVAVAAEGRARGADVSIETCPHYLFFTGEDLERLGVVAKCAPPLRPAEDQGQLWSALLDGAVDMVASDHSPSEPSLKIEGDFRRSWGGIAGVQSTLAVLFDRDRHRVSPERIVALVSATPARRFQIERKGTVAVGNDGDLVLVDPMAAHTLDAGRLHQRHKMSPYIGSEFRGTVRRTIRRGETIFLDGRIVAAATRGRYVRPHH